MRIVRLRPRSRPRPAAAAPDEGGFTLLEVLIAFVIAALAVGALLQGAAGGLQNARVASHTQEAVARAQSRLAALSASLQPGEQGGDDGGGFLWRVSVQPGPAIAVPRPAAASPPGTQRGAPPGDRDRTILYAVTVALSWQSDGAPRRVVLATQRLGIAPPEPP